MKRFGDFIKEDLDGALVEPQSASSQQAAKLGLVYVGFGRYENPKTQQITHVVQNDKLVPFNRAIKTNTYKNTNSNDLTDYSTNMAPFLDQTHQELTSHYEGAGYGDNELTALQSWTAPGAHYAINNRLWQLPSGLPADQIMPAYDGDPIPQYIDQLDKALAKSVAPMNVKTYVSLPKDYDVTQLQKNTVIGFKGYRSTSLDPSIAVDVANAPTNVSVFDTRRKNVVLQINVKKGSPGAYIDDYSSTPGEREFLLPRGSAVKITGDPKKIVAGNAQSGRDDEITYYDCELVPR